jgi:EAL domain-containing protein (putative c-di-GMP-specific phosphodiesterase class I)
MDQMSRQQGALPRRVVVIIGHGRGAAHVPSLCRQLGFSMIGSAGSGSAGLELIASLPAAPDLIVVDAGVPDMDVADLLVSLSMLECDASLIVHGIECPRIQDTAVMLAATLGLAPSAAVCAPLSLEALRAAVDDIGLERARAGPSRRGSLVRPPALDAVDIRNGLLGGEFELHYQPQVALADCNLRGAEALLRWRHPRHGMLAPASFLQQAEEGGLVELLTMKVLRMALADCEAWKAMGFSLPVSVNLSPLALTNPHMGEQIIDAVRGSGLPPSAIAFEITEHTEIADLGVALRILLKLRLQGHRLSLDDYGAGHGSILQLSRIPFSELKIDQRLVQDAWKRAHLRPLLKQAIESARELGVTSVAEGIECRQDWEFMRSLGCDLAQGYLIARPMPAGLLPAWRPDIFQLREQNDG